MRTVAKSKAKTVDKTNHFWRLWICAAAVFVIGLGIWNSAAARTITHKIFAVRDMFQDDRGPRNCFDVVYYHWYSVMSVGHREAPDGQGATALGFDLSDPILSNDRIENIYLAINRAWCTGMMNIQVTETEDDNWQDDYNTFPSLLNPTPLYQQSWGQSGIAQSPDMQDYILDQYFSGDRYLTLLVTSDSSTQYTEIISLESDHEAACLKVVYKLSEAVISTPADPLYGSMNGLVLDMELKDDSFTSTTLSPTMFTLDSETRTLGFTVSDVVYIDSTHAQITLAGPEYVQEDMFFDITVSGSVLEFGDPVVSNALHINACNIIVRGGVYDLCAMGERPDVYVYTTEHVTLIQTSAEALSGCTVIGMVAGLDLEIRDTYIFNQYVGGAGLIFTGRGNTLTLTGTNRIAGMDRPAVCVQNGAELTIQGTGSLDATTLQYAGAIGSRNAEQLGDIIINSGTIKARCIGAEGFSAGIGTGSYGESSVGTITINGGVIDAIGGINAPGIGAGYNGKMHAITINGGTIVARGGNADGAAIGAGESAVVESVTINGGNVQAGFSGGGIGIGAGFRGTVDTISISGGVVNARWGGESDAAIGCDAYGVVNHIHITGGLIFADGYATYCDDIGYGKYLPETADMDVQISGMAVVFLRNNKLADRDDGITLPFYDNETITDNQAYGYTLPEYWSGTAYAYVAPEIPVTGIANTQKELRLNLNTAQTAQLTAETIPTYAENNALLYASGNLGVAIVDANGLVTPVSIGKAEIAITTVEGGFSDTCTVTVYNGLTAMEVTPAETILYLDGEPGTDTVTLAPLFTPADASDQAVTYRSNNIDVATVNINGVVTAVAVGNTTITVTSNDGGLEATCVVTVRQITTGITLSPIASYLVLGDQNTANDTVTIGTAVSPSNAYNKTIMWESTNPSVATVDQNGLVTALQSGHTTIQVTAEDGGAYAEASITVEQRVTGIMIAPTEAVLLLGSGNLSDGSITFSYTVSPSDAKDQSAQFTSSDPSVVSITGNRALAWKVGNATITVTSNDGGFTASCPVHVRQSVTGISLDETEATLYLDDGNVSNDTLQLTATVVPDSAYDKAVSWESSAPDVATVDEKGLVTAVKGGETIITATSSNINRKAACKITVNQGVISIELVPETAMLVLGDGDTDNDTIQLTTTITPQDATDPSFNYHSSDPAVASVDSVGLVTALKKGTATITVTSADGIHQASCEVTVERRLMLHGSGQNGKVCVGCSITLTPSLGGGTWSYNTEYLSRQGNTFTPLRPGTTIVTYSLDDKGKSKTLLQTLLGLFVHSASAANIEEASFTITAEALTLTSSLTDGKAFLNSSFILTPNFTGGIWDYDTESLTRIGGTFHPRKEGTATITYTYSGQTVSYQAVIYDYPATGDGRPPAAGLVFLTLLPVLLGAWMLRLRRARKR